MSKSLFVSKCLDATGTQLAEAQRWVILLPDPLLISPWICLVDPLLALPCIAVMGLTLASYWTISSLFSVQNGEEACAHEMNRHFFLRIFKPARLMQHS